MADEVHWFERAIREHSDRYGPSGGAWNISMVLECLHRHHRSLGEEDTVELHSSRRQPFPRPENLQESRRHESSQDQRLDRLEHRDTDLERRMTKAMADIDTLMSILSGIASDASTLTDDFKNLEGELQAAQQAAANNQPIDLTNAILTARNAQAALDAVVASAGSVGATPAPAAAPASDQAPVGDQAPVSASGSGDQAPVDQAPSDQAPVDQAPSDEAPVDQAPADQPPADQAPADQPPADQAPASDQPPSDQPSV